MRKREKIVEGGEERQERRVNEPSKIQVLPNICGEKTGFSSS